MTINEFINKVIFKELREIICEHGYHYHGFILVACAIEFAGALLDFHDFHKLNLSEKRFKAACKKFPPQYDKEGLSNALYTVMRCGMCHAMRPKPGIGLTYRKQAAEFGLSHLQREPNGRITLVIEDLFEDLCKALETIRQLPPNQRRDLNMPFLDVPEDNDATSPSLSGNHRYKGTCSDHR